MENIIIIAVLAVIVGSIVWYLYRAKKRGQKCVGCPYAGECASHCSCNEKASQIKK